MGETALSAAPSSNLDMFTMVVLRRRIEAIIREMTSALFRSGRSGVLNTAMDFSCSLTDAQFRSVSVALGLPVHVGAIHLIPAAVVDKFGRDLAPGDCFVNNSGYLGNTHCADFTLRASLPWRRADILLGGAPISATWAVAPPQPRARRVRGGYDAHQRGYADVPVIDICKANIGCRPVLRRLSRRPLGR